MSNEAAERLRATLTESARGDGAGTGALLARLSSELDAALAAERRETVERIRAAVGPAIYKVGHRTQTDDLDLTDLIVAALDAEAAP